MKGINPTFVSLTCFARSQIERKDKKLWTKDQEIDFFTKSLEVASPEQLF